MQTKKNEPDNASADKQKFLAACGNFAAVTPPEIIMLLSTSLVSDAIYASARLERPPKRSAPAGRPGVVPSPRKAWPILRRWLSSPKRT
jgi:hypothetical protein